MRMLRPAHTYVASHAHALQRRVIHVSRLTYIHELAPPSPHGRMQRITCNYGSCHPPCLVPILFSLCYLAKCLWPRAYSETMKWRDRHSDNGTRCRCLPESVTSFSSLAGSTKMKIMPHMRRFSGLFNSVTWNVAMECPDVGLFVEEPQIADGMNHESRGNRNCIDENDGMMKRWKEIDDEIRW